MPDPVTPEVETPDKPTPGQQDPPEPSNGNEKPDAPPEPSTEVEELEIEGLEKTDDGYEYTVGNSVYKGKTISEAINNSSKGTADKDKSSKELDRQVRELKAKQAIRVPEKFGTKEESSIDLPPWANEKEIYTKALQARGVDPQMAGWGREQWRQHKETNELMDYEIVQLQQEIKGAYSETQKTVADQNATRLNLETVVDSQEAVQEMIVDAGLDPDELAVTFHEVLTAVWKDPATHDANGILKPTAIVRAMYKKIAPSLSSKQKTAVQQVLDDEAEKARKLKEGTRAGAGTGGNKLKEPVKKPANIQEASKLLLKEIQAGRM